MSIVVVLQQYWHSSGVGSGVTAVVLQWCWYWCYRSIGTAMVLVVVLQKYWYSNGVGSGVTAVVLHHPAIQLLPPGSFHTMSLTLI